MEDNGNSGLSKSSVLFVTLCLKFEIFEILISFALVLVNVSKISLVNMLATLCLVQSFAFLLLVLSSCPVKY